MAKFKELLLKEYGKEYDFKLKKQYSEPKIYTANGDLSKKWYVYFSFRNPNTGKLERQKPVYVSLKITSKRERMKHLKIYQEALIKLLESGYSPYVKNEFEEESVLMNVNEAFNHALSIKKLAMNDYSYKKFSQRIRRFLKFTEEIGYNFRNINELNRKVVNEYLKRVQSKSSASNRNNSRRDLNTIYSVLVKENIVKYNIISNIDVIKAKPIKNKAYTAKEADRIFEYIKNKDPQLLLFLQFVSYAFLRPVEVCRLKIKDIDMESRRLYFKSKGKPLKTKIIVDLLYNELPDLSKYDLSHYMFTPEGVPNDWKANESSRRNYFTDQYSKIKKELGFGPEYNVYSFRHSFAVRIYRELRKTKSPFEAKSYLMLITGHASMSSLEKYLREIDAELPEDYSDLLK